MSTGFPYFRSASAEEGERLRRASGWIMVWGVLLIVGGIAAIMFPVVATVVSVEVFGIFLLFAAVGQVITAIRVRGWGGTLAAILIAILYFFAGIVLLERPLLGAAGYTLFLAMLFFAVGTVRIVAAVADRHSGWGWGVVSGGISVLLGILIWRSFPEAALWVIGTFVGIDLLFAGFSWLMLALAVRNVTATARPPA